MTQKVMFEPSTAIVNVSMLGLPMATGSVVFTVLAYSGDDPRLAVEGTDIRLGRGTTYTVKKTSLRLSDAVAEPPNVGWHHFETFSTLNHRAAVKQVREHLLDIGHASLGALVQDPGFAAWVIGAHVSFVRSELKPHAERQVRSARRHLSDTETELQACEDIIAVAGPLTNEQLRLAIVLVESNHSLGLAIEAARQI